ncbi:bifunctional phosphopantothenoylcysteine decarboxylase/phosphopantothenate--cysteine ligase CoaBC [Nonomuraea sp. NEAU-A123]|uniref:bifunctional phosphopantothenoylcysteine decarboxylase/phosphopantothenate--cysteine ligase CoaBC n=1 Tax=Nonomuraea sp. NEAU-A123 TaxID=2839649 RepID=UPI001BE45F73|nr:bifunctional phosphopantothenoylcysteine decarboxylase/phosphopantothenate--cysteine ligase CoaBC [Nonomuraea sp. NEAU-A123]MBT2228801.1 bifunctional phosphopantothenoylcysteine decarboxylase/phosphopantothenate--cysteine ligase CoaBC [Nonomuraea sp. NEAU-A123]
MKVVLGVSGGIAAYKACELLRLFTESGHEVRVVPTRDALRFVGEPTWAALSGNPVTTDVWDDVHEVPHVRIGQRADLVVVAPATADVLAKAAHGLAGDLLTNTLLTARCPVVFAPAMHTEMWQHPATRANVSTLRERGSVVIDPAVGRLTGADSGPGRLPDPAEIFQVCLRVLAGRPRDLAGRHVVVSAGGTREAIDPVRYLGNRSSGLQGYALARTAVARGAHVTLVAANVSLPDPAGADVVRVESAAELREAVLAASNAADVVVMAAAVADFRPAARHDSKIKKSDGEPDPLYLVKNPDILAELGERRRAGGPKPEVIVGFAAETDDVLANGQAKLARKGCDLLVVNQVGPHLAFGTPDNAATVLVAGGEPVEIPRGPKDDVADAVWDQVSNRLRHPRTPADT